MSTLPGSGYFSDGARTQDEMKAALDSQRNVIAEMPGGSVESTLTIASGTVIPTVGSHAIDTEGAAASDNLDYITYTNMPDGRLLLIHSVNSARVVVVRHAQGGAGQIVLQSGTDLSLRDSNEYLMLSRIGSNWVEVFRSSIITFNGLPGSFGLIAANNTGTPNTKFDITATQLSFYNPTTKGTSTIVAPGTITNDVTVSNASTNGRDQALNFSTDAWIHFYLVLTSSGTVVSRSSTALPSVGPALQATEIAWVYVGAVRFNGSSQLVGTRILGNVAFYDAGRNVLILGASTSEATVPVSTVVPPNALSYSLVGYVGAMSDGSSALDLYTYIKIVASTIFCTVRTRVNAMYAPGQDIMVPVAIPSIPNVGQQFYYQHVFNGIGQNPILTLDVNSYRLPNGGA